MISDKMTLAMTVRPKTETRADNQALDEIAYLFYTTTRTRTKSV
jgi:hypothetical protein